jgi:hypothetical protein
MNNETYLRERLTEYLDYLLLKPHIECKPILKKYRFKMMMNEHLTPKEFSNILKFLRRDSNRSDKDLRRMFKTLVRATSKALNTSVEKVTLDAFLT